MAATYAAKLFASVLSNFVKGYIQPFTIAAICGTRVVSRRLDSGKDVSRFYRV
jgi:hypothetical protein